MAVSAESFSAREAARITGLSLARVRRLSQHGVLKERPYDFRDLVLLRQVKRLLDAGVPLHRIRSACVALDQRGDSPARLMLSMDHGAVVAAREGVRWDASSGQLVLPLAAEASKSVVFHLKPTTPGLPLDADQWFERGVELEPSSIADAIDAYRHALDQEPCFIEANINLGRLLHTSGSLLEAKNHYERALWLDPMDPIPAFNLGVVLEDLGCGDDAIRFYRTALQRDADFVLYRGVLCRFPWSFDAAG